MVSWGFLLLVVREFFDRVPKGGVPGTPGGSRNLGT